MGIMRIISCQKGTAMRTLNYALEAWSRLWLQAFHAACDENNRSDRSCHLTSQVAWCWKQTLEPNDVLKLPVWL